jgi:hypothetical protein
MSRKQMKKQGHTRRLQTKKPGFSKKRKRYYAFGFFVGEY